MRTGLEPSSKVLTHARWLAALVLLALIPSVRLAWLYRDMPHFGHLHDDAMYWVSAKSLAQGDGYRALSVPGEPWQTKFPPAYPALMSLVWRLAPTFPHNLTQATLVSWIAIPLFLVTSWLVFTQMAFPHGVRALLCAMVALCPWVAFYGMTLFSDLFFCVLVLAALLLAEEASKSSHGWRYALAAGVFAAMAYLTRTAALALLVTTPVCFVLRRQYRCSVVFAAAMFPAVAAWTLWVNSHVPHGGGETLLYYTDYPGLYRHNVTLADVPQMLITNAAAFLGAFGNLAIFQIAESAWATPLVWLVTVGSAAGLMRRLRARRLIHLGAFVIIYIALMLIWHYPPNERFLLPVYVPMLGGLADEVRHLLKPIMHAWQIGGRSSRIAACLILCLFAAAGALATRASWVAYSAFFPEYFNADRRERELRRPVYDWVRRHVPSQARFFAYADPTFYLYTGVRAIHVPPNAVRKVYRKDMDGVLQPFRRFSDFVSEWKLDYMLLTESDYDTELNDSMRAEVERALIRTPGAKLVFQSPGARIYGIAPSGEQAWRER